MDKYLGLSLNWKDYFFDLFISEDRLREFSGPSWKPQNIASVVLARLLNNGGGGSPEVNYDTLDKILIETGIPRVAILDAHGGYKNGIWIYSDTREKWHEKVVQITPINTWIKEHSNKEYGALVLSCCNEKGLAPNFGLTAIFYAEGNVGLTSLYKTRLLKPIKQI